MMEEKEVEYLTPKEIEKRSFEIIKEELTQRGIKLPKEEEPITKRVILHDEYCRLSYWKYR